MLGKRLVKGPIAFPLIAVMLVSILASGCASTNKRVDHWFPDESFQIIEDDLSGKDVKILLGDGTIHEGELLRINTETTTWGDYDTETVISVPTAEIWRIQTMNRSKGAGKGFGLGLLIGAGTGVLVGVASGGSQSDVTNQVVLGAVGFAAVGGLLGLVIGGSKGTTITYEINPGLTPSGTDAEAQ